ncbi:hypothetical protein RJ640_002521 [Escallonia rubra]|uniref:ZPR1 jelly-roll domain-containing protein n=1 Tax=Escallonia rubra TaxID=112253 RepID=A0AA88S309_9ASTE|nr:hypothetical protein RJ640_002521 [Escallonia rubra]
MSYKERKRVDSQTAEALDQFLLKLEACVAGDSSFIFILDDPAGNGFIENPFGPSPDPSLKIKSYERTPEQQALLGYIVGPSHLGEEATTGAMNNVSDQITREQYGTVGAPAGRGTIAQVAQLASGLAQRLDPFSPETDGVSPQGVTSGSNPSFVIGDPTKKVQWVETTRKA